MSGRLRAFAAAFALASALLPAAAWAQASPSPFTSATRYDSERRVTGTIAPDPDGTGPLHHAAVRNSYDPAGRLVRQEKGELAAWQGEAVAPADWTGFTIFQSVDTQYDALGRKTREAASGGGVVSAVTEYGYDLVGRPQCTAVRMNPDAWAAPLADKCAPGPAHAGFGPDRIVRNSWDSAGQLLKVEKAVGTALRQDYARYEYSDDGKQKAVTDADGNRAEMRYDGFDRLSCWVFPSKTTAGALGGDCLAGTGDLELYAYDVNGNRISLRKRDGTTLTYAYDALDRLTVKTVPASATGAAGYSVYSGYDNRGLQTYARFGSASGPGIANSWDGFGRLASSTSTMGGASRTLAYGLDADGNRIGLYGNGGYSGYYAGFVFDGLDRMSAYAGEVAIGYDTAGRRSSVSSWPTATTYGYDGAGRLTSLVHDLAGTAADQTAGYAYNPASQIVTRTGSNDAYAAPPDAVHSLAYQVNGLNQYVAASNRSYGYDANGNFASDGTTNYVYDAENRLVSASGQTNATLAYDPLGRLWRVTGAGGVTEFVYDGDKLLLEYNGAGSPLSAYVHGPGADDPLVWNEIAGGAGFRYLRSDHQGSIVALADRAGNSVGKNSYDAWGVPAAGNQGRFGYTGQTWIGELGLWYYKARFYSPMLGRFLQTDPVGYEDDVNLYAYVGNDPINRVDSTGRGGVEFFIKVLKYITTREGTPIERETLRRLPTEKAAVRAREQGRNVVVRPDRGSSPTSRIARRIEERASGRNNTVRHDAHGNNDRPASSESNSHYQPENRPPGRSGLGHTIYSTLALGTAVGTMDPNAGTVDRVVSHVADFFNPVANVRDIVGLVGGYDD